jgi:hypothetical protein
MKTRRSVVALVTLVLLYQIFAGTYGVGTVLCVGGANGLELLPAGTNCCAQHAKSEVADTCCASDAATECENADVGAKRTVTTPRMANPNDCLDCIDRELMVQLFTQPSHVYDKSTLSPSVIIATLSWSAFSEPLNPDFMWCAGERPPSLRILRMWSTVILRC